MKWKYAKKNPPLQYNKRLHKMYVDPKTLPQAVKTKLHMHVAHSKCAARLQHYRAVMNGFGGTGINMGKC